MYNIGKSDYFTEMSLLQLKGGKKATNQPQIFTLTEKPTVHIHGISSQLHVYTSAQKDKHVGTHGHAFYNNIVI